MWAGGGLYGMRANDLHGQIVMLIALTVVGMSACATQAGHEQPASELDEQPAVTETPAVVEDPAVADRGPSVPTDQHQAALSKLRAAERRTDELEKTVSEMGSRNEALQQEIDQLEVRLAQAEADRDKLQKMLDAILNPPAATPEPGNETEPQVDVYTVEPGDTFHRIAAKTEVYGNEERWQDLYEANREPLGLGRPEDLQPGMVLEIKRP